MSLPPTISLPRWPQQLALFIPVSCANGKDTAFRPSFTVSPGTVAGSWKRSKCLGLKLCSGIGVSTAGRSLSNYTTVLTLVFHFFVVTWS